MSFTVNWDAFEPMVRSGAMGECVSTLLQLRICAEYARDMKVTQQPILVGPTINLLWKKTAKHCSLLVTVYPSLLVTAGA